MTDKGYCDYRLLKDLIVKHIIIREGRAIKRIIFACKCTRSFGRSGEEDGYSVSISSGGCVEVCNYVFGQEKPIKRKTVIQDIEIEKRVLKIIRKYSRLISKMPGLLNNGSSDGTCDAFVLDDKEIIAWNISKTSLLKIIYFCVCHHGYYKKYQQSIYFENLLLKICGEVESVLKDYTEIRLPISGEGEHQLCQNLSI